MKKLKVLHQVNNLAIGGVETFVYRLAKYANEETYVYTHKNGIVTEWLEADGIVVFNKDETNLIDLLYLLDIDVLVMHTGSYLPEYAEEVRSKFPNLKMITVLHTVYQADDWVDKIICVSQAIKDVNTIDKAILIYPGIDRRHDFVIGEVTRVAPYKYIEDLIEIVGIVAPDYPEVKLKIIGEDALDHIGYTNDLKVKIHDLGLDNNVEFVGYVDKVDYKWFDAFIHLVGNEAYPVTILEALNAGLPTFTYKRIGTDEIIHTHLCKVNPDTIGKQHIIDMIKLLIKERPKHIKEVANEFTKVYNENTILFL